MGPVFHHYVVSGKGVDFHSADLLWHKSLKLILELGWVDRFGITRQRAVFKHLRGIHIMYLQCVSTQNFRSFSLDQRMELYAFGMQLHTGNDYFNFLGSEPWRKCFCAGLVYNSGLFLKMYHWSRWSWVIIYEVNMIDYASVFDVYWNFRDFLFCSCFCDVHITSSFSNHSFFSHSNQPGSFCIIQAGEYIELWPWASVDHCLHQGLQQAKNFNSEFTFIALHTCC